MNKVKNLNNETQRLQALASYSILDTDPEFNFDDITSLVATICESPIALVSLVDKDRQWFKSHHGLDATQTDRDISFCTHAIEQSEIFEVCNALEDERFCDNPLVIGEPKVVFYAGQPLISPEGHKLGTLCVIDHKPKKLNGDQRKALKVLGRQVLTQMELRKKNLLLKLTNAELENKNKIMTEQEEQIINNSKMISLGVMAAGMAHEVNNPLGVIAMSSLRIQSLLKKEEFDQEGCLDSCNKIDKTVDRISKIIKGLRSIARDVRHDPMEIVNIRDIIDDALNICRQKFVNHDIDLRLKGLRDEVILCRGGEIAQVLLNLLENAYDAISESLIRWIEVNISDDNEKLRISITDSGPGISKDIQKNIMEPFFTTKGVGKGTGLGLSISYGIMKSHDAILCLDKDSEYTKFDLIFKKAKSRK